MVPGVPAVGTEDLNGFFAFLTVSPAPPFPEHIQLQLMGGVVWCWTGGEDEAAEALAAARLLEPALDGVQAMRRQRRRWSMPAASARSNRPGNGWIALAGA